MVPPSGVNAVACIFLGFSDYFNLSSKPIVAEPYQLTLLLKQSSDTSLNSLVPKLCQTPKFYWHKEQFKMYSGKLPNHLN